MEYWNKLPAQKKEWLKWLGVVVIIGVLGFLGVTNPALPVPPTPSPAPIGEIGAQAVARQGIICNGGETYCVDARSGKDLATYADAGGATRTWYVDGATGNQTSSGYYSGANWAKVAAPTAIATATPAFVVNSAGVSNLFEAQKNATPVVQVSGAGNLIAVSADIGGGYSSTGCTISSAGVLQCAGAATTDGALTAASAAIGGGFGSTGCTLSAAGVLQCDGAATLGSTLTVTDAVTFNGTVAGPAEGKVVYNTIHDATAAEINAGHTIVTVPAARQFRLVDVTAIAYGGACGAVTTVDLKAGSVFLATYAQANLTQSTQLRTNSTGVTMLADGASFTAQVAGDDVTVIKAGSDVTTCTGVRFILSYALE